MPSVYTHFVLLDEIVKRLGPQQQSIVEANQEYAYWGSVGPDFFYFFEQDWGLAGALSEFYFELYDELEEVVTLANQVKSFKEDVEDWISGGLTAEIRDVARRTEVLVNGLVAKFLTSNVDFFEVFTPPIARDPRTSAVNGWWLADLAHQRKTTSFARTLWKGSETNAALRAYAMGYVSHVATDAVGHSVVNLIVGGPYRTQWRRHGFVEKILDTHYWRRFRGDSLTRSGAHKLIEMTPAGAGSAPDMPGDLVRLLKQAIDENYQSYNLANGLPDEDSINNMYRLYHRYLRSTSTLGGLNMPEPEDFDWFDLPDFVTDHLDKVWNKRPNIGRPPPSNILNLNDWKSFLSGIIRSALWLAEVVITIATLPAAVIARLTTTPARYLLWLMQQALYDLYQDIRLALVLGGYLHPEPIQVDRRFGSIADPSSEDWNRYWEVYGFVHATNPEQTYHLVHPSQLHPYPASEPPQSRPLGRLPPDIEHIVGSGAPGFGDAALTEILFDPRFVYFDGLNELINARDQFAPNNNVPTQHPDYWKLPVPSAVAAGVEFMGRFTDNGGADLDEVNMDGDRGYIWPNWTTDTAPANWQSLQNFRFVD